MHISDGILTVPWIILWYVISIPVIFVGINEIKKKSRLSAVYIPMVSLMGASVFVISVWHIPVPVTGSSSHPIGTPMAAIILGPFVTVVTSTIALFFHLFLAHGGITTLGANTVSMGIVGGFSGYAVYKISRKMGASIFIAAGAAGFIGDILTYVTTALELALGLHPDNFIYYWSIFSLGFIPTQLPLAVLEFFFTGYTVQYIATHRPEIIENGIKKIRGTANVY